MYSYSYTSKSEEETAYFAEKLSPIFKPGIVLALFGNLASGKTTLTRYICHILGIKDWFGSPSFTIINEYYAGFPVYHIDFYRLSSEEEVYSLGIETYLSDKCLTIIEWPELIEDILPANTTIRITIKTGKEINSREFFILSPFELKSLPEQIRNPQISPEKNDKKQRAEQDRPRH